MMTWWRENWRLYRIRCEIWSEINGIVNVTSFWVSSWDRGLLVPYLSLINKIILVAKTVRLVMSTKVCHCGIYSLHSIVRLFQARLWYSIVRLSQNIVRTFHKSLGHKQKQRHFLCVFFRSQKRALHLTRKLWSNLTINWNDLAWNDLTMGRNNSKPSMLLNCPDSRDKAPPSSISAALTGWWTYNNILIFFKSVKGLNPWVIIFMSVVLNRTVVDSDWHFDNLCSSHLQSQSELYHVSWWYY